MFLCALTCFKRDFQRCTDNIVVDHVLVYICQHWGLIDVGSVFIHEILRGKLNVNVISQKSSLLKQER